MAVATFALASGNAQADPFDYHTARTTLQDECTGKMMTVVTFNSPLDDQVHWIEEEEYQAAIDDGHFLAKYCKAHPETTVAQVKEMATDRTKQRYSSEKADAPYVDFYAAMLCGTVLLDLEKQVPQLFFRIRL
jgi:hypothetical protein